MIKWTTRIFTDKRWSLLLCIESADVWGLESKIKASSHACTYIQVTQACHVSIREKFAILDTRCYAASWGWSGPRRKWGRHLTTPQRISKHWRRTLDGSWGVETQEGWLHGHPRVANFWMFHCWTAGTCRVLSLRERTGTETRFGSDLNEMFNADGCLIVVKRFSQVLRELSSAGTRTQ